MPIVSASTCVDVNKNFVEEEKERGKGRRMRCRFLDAGPGRGGGSAGPGSVFAQGASLRGAFPRPPVSRSISGQTANGAPIATSIPHHG